MFMSYYFLKKLASKCKQAIDFISQNIINKQTHVENCRNQISLDEEESIIFSENNIRALNDIHPKVLTQNEIH